MLTSGMREAQQGEVSLDHLEPEVVNALVDYFYMGKIKIEFNKMEEAVEACGFLQLVRLQEDFGDIFACILSQLIIFIG